MVAEGFLRIESFPSTLPRTDPAFGGGRSAGPKDRTNVSLRGGVEKMCTLQILL